MGKKAKDGAKQRTSSSASATTVPAPTTDSASVTNSPTVIDSTVSSPDPVHSPRRTRALGSLLLVAILAILGVGILGLIRHNNAANVDPYPKNPTRVQRLLYEIRHEKNPADLLGDYKGLADEYYTQKDYANSIKTYQAAIALFPNDANLKYQLGKEYFSFRDGTNAAKYIKAAIDTAKKDPKHANDSNLEIWEGYYQASKDHNYNDPSAEPLGTSQ